MDVIFGIPDSSDIPKDDFNQIKAFFKKIASRFALSNRGAHFGVVRYSGTASMDLKLDSLYQYSQLNKFIINMKQQGNHYLLI